MKRTIITLSLLAIGFTAFSQTKQPRVYYVSFTEQQFLQIQKRMLHADSLLANSDSRAKDIIPAKDALNDLWGAFVNAYIRRDTLSAAPVKVEVKKAN
jgi:hypothetical protein